MAQCRFCKKYVVDGQSKITTDGVKYSVRHYAHFRCYITSGKPLWELHDWQIVLFPAKVIKEFALHDTAKAAFDREEKRLAKWRDQ